MGNIEIKGLTRDYGQGRGIFDVNLSIDEGEVFGFLGPNGAGKTTTIRHLMGFIRPKKGSCTIGGMDCWEDAPAIHENLGYIPGETAFLNHMTGKEYIRFMASFRGMKDLGRAPEIMERFDLDASGKIKKMSKGMKQKVGIVCAFMHDPHTIILDEPSSGLDPLMQNEFINLVLEEKDRGKTILLSSHMFEEVERTCGRVAIIRRGSLAVTESVEYLKATQIKRYVVTLDTKENALLFAGGDYQVEKVEGTRVTVKVTNDLSDFLSALVYFPVEDLTQINQSLEDIFLHYYGEERVGGVQ